VVFDEDNNDNNDDNDNKHHDDTSQPPLSLWMYWMFVVLPVCGLCHAWRGAAFIPHPTASLASSCYLLLSLLWIGLPLMVLELSLGRAARLGAIGIWQSPLFAIPSCGDGGDTHNCPYQKKPWTGLGVMSLVLGWVLCFVNVAIMTWIVHVLADTFATSISFSDGAGGTHANPWTTNTHNKDTTTAQQIQALDYFLDQVIGQSTLSTSNDLKPTRFMVDNVGFAALLWGLIGVGVAFGTRCFARISAITTTLALAGLITIWGVTAFSEPELTETNNEVQSSSVKKESIDHSELWSQAILQTLFITSVVIGVLPTYGSIGPSNRDASSSGEEQHYNVARNSILIVLVNALVMFMTGWAIVTAVGSPSGSFWDTWDNTNHHDLPNSNFQRNLALVFVLWPTALLHSLEPPYGILWVRVLYSSFVLLGLLFSWAVVTAILTMLRDANTCSAPRYDIR
jgi:SNF family Na+-dependent transporter